MSIVFYIAVFIFGITAAFFLTSFFVSLFPDQLFRGRLHQESEKVYAEGYRHPRPGDKGGRPGCLAMV